MMNLICIFNTGIGLVTIMTSLKPTRIGVGRLMGMGFEDRASYGYSLAKVVNFVKLNS